MNFTALLAAVEPELEAKQETGGYSCLMVNRRIGVLSKAPPISPDSINQPEDLGDEMALIFCQKSSLKLKSPAGLGYDFHWLREAAPGGITGELGLQVEAGVSAEVEIALAAQTTGVVTLDDQRRLNLRIFRGKNTGVGLTCRAAACAQARTPLPADPGELALAILGIHEGQWLEEMARQAQNGGPEQKFARFFELWNTLDSRVAAAIWKAAGDERTLASVRDWANWIATALNNQDAFRTELNKAIESVPGFTRTGAAQWIEAASGNLYAAANELPRFELLVAAANATNALLTEAGLAQALKNLKDYATAKLGLERLSIATTGQSAGDGLAAWIKSRIGGSNLGEKIVAAIGVAESLHAKALEALGDQYAAELTLHYETASSRTVLIDCSFEFTPEGLVAYRKALSGDLTEVLREGNPHIALRSGLLTHGLKRLARFELRLPFLERRQWESRVEALAGMRIETSHAGRAILCTLDASASLERQDLYQSTLVLSGTLVRKHMHAFSHFRLAYSDVRRIPATQARLALVPVLRSYGFPVAAEEWLRTVETETEEVEAAVSLSAPGELVDAWLNAPGERDANFTPVYRAVSVAVQQAMRKWLPYVYFNEVSRYNTLGAAYPLLIYQCTLPFRGKSKDQFTYDVMDTESTALARRSTGCALNSELERVHQLLLAADKPDVARFYRPSRKSTILASVERQPRNLNALLVADALFVDSLVRLGQRAARIRRNLEGDPAKAVSEMAKFAGDFVTAFHRKLRRLYGGQDFLRFGSLLLVEATAALNTAVRSEAGISGTLRLALRDREGRTRMERTFLNAPPEPGFGD